MVAPSSGQNWQRWRHLVAKIVNGGASSGQGEVGEGGWMGAEGPLAHEAGVHPAGTSVGARSAPLR